ncbi:hypothetical protein [Streptomyces humidus]|uniref:hypothetical protein n=1 Tax=Streptomyces humidus TaxID=52259 RepID=UPI00331EDBCE
MTEPTRRQKRRFCVAASTHRVWLVALATVLLLAGVDAAGAGISAAAGAPSSGGAKRWSTPGPQRALSGVLQPGPVVHAQAGPPAPAARAQRTPRRPGHPRRRPGPADPAPALVPDVSPRLGAPVPDPDHRPTPPPRDPRRLTLFRDTSVPVTTGLPWWKPEPSTDQSGRDIFATGNFHAEFSRDNGRNWRGLDPYTVFGPDFCCDQVTKADFSYRRQHWVLQYIPAFNEHPGGGHLVLANSRIGDFVDWRPYTITPSTFGWSDDLNLDYNDVVIGHRFLYLTTRLIRFHDGTDDYDVLAAALLRVSRADLAAGRPAHYDSITRTDTIGGGAYGEDGELRVPQGITDVAYAASTTLPEGKGRRLRLLVWPEKSQWVTTVDRDVPPFRYMTFQVPGREGDCSSKDKTVTNWCGGATSGGVFAARGRGHLWFAWAAQQYGTQRPFPYVRITVVRESDLRVGLSHDVYSRTIGHAYPAIAPDERGHIGYIDAFGGGAGNSHYFPGSMIAVFDDITPVSPSVDYFLPGKGNACSGSNPQTGDEGEWGDYLTVRGWHPGGGVWIATAMARVDDTPADCSTAGPMTIKNIVFGRERDRHVYERGIDDNRR